MANRYWVGGTANWDGTAGTKWAATSNGPGGETVPTSADDVFFDGSSTGTCTIATGNTGAKTINCTGFTGTITGTVAITVSGNITLDAGMTYTHTGTITVNATATIVIAGKTFSGLTINGSGITVTLGDSLTTHSAGDVNVSQGTFNTANYNVTARALTSSNTNVRTITLGSSTVTLSSTATPVNFSTSTNLTFNADTSEIVITGISPTIAPGSRTFYNVSFTSTTAGNITVQQASTFNNLTVTAPGSAGIMTVSLAGNITVNGTLSCSGASALRRMFIQSGTVRTARTITVATCAPADCDFRDITISGAASPISGTRLGDCGGNTNITFDAPKTVYWNSASAANFFSANWAASSGSTTLSENNLPLAQDIAVIDNNSRAGINGIAVNMNVGEIDSSLRTTAISLSLFSAAWNLYKNLKLGTSVTTAGTSLITFSGTTTQTITSNGRTLSGAIAVNAPSNTVELADAVIISSGFMLTAGTFDAKSYNVTTSTCALSGTITREIKMGSGTWTLSGTGTVWGAATSSALTIDKGTANIILTNTSATSRTFGGGGLSYNKLTIGGATGTSTLTISGSNTFTELASIKTVAHTITFTAGTTQTVGAWTITGTSGNVVTLQSSAASAYTLAKTGGGTVSCDYMSISYSTATPVSTWYAGTNSTNGGNNSGWSFTAAPFVSTGNFFSIFY